MSKEQQLVPNPVAEGPHASAHVRVVGTHDVMSLPLAKRRILVVDTDRPALSDSRLAITADRLRQRVSQYRSRRQRSSLALNHDSIARVPSVDAERSLVFPPGHPTPGVVYVADPVRAEYYYPAAEFHRRAFEMKLADATLLLMSLGATSISVHHEQGWDKEFASGLNVALLKRVGGNLTGRASGSTEALFEATLRPNDPQEPESRWLEHEPMWQTLVDARRRLGMEEFTLELSWRQSFGIDSDLEGKVKRLGLSLGGEMQAFKATLWNMKAQFEPVGTRTP